MVVGAAGPTVTRNSPSGKRWMAISCNGNAKPRREPARRRATTTAGTGWRRAFTAAVSPVGGCVAVDRRSRYSPCGAPTARSNSDWSKAWMR